MVNNKTVSSCKITNLVMSARNIIPGMFLLLFLYSCSRQTMSKEDAERSLKVLNSDMVNFGNRMSESPEMEVWSFLMKHRDAPVPFYKNSNQFISIKDFQFKTMKGVYHWNPAGQKFDKTNDSDDIIIFPDTTGNSSLQFILNAYESQKVNSGEQFPIQLKIKMIQDKEEFWSMDYNAKLADGMPENISLAIKGDSYNIRGSYLRTRNGVDGTLNVGFSFDYLMKTLIATQLDCTIGYGLHGYYLKTIHADQQIFDHDIKGDVDYASIDPTAADYTASFNSHCKASIIEKGKGVVGDIILAGTENNELNDFFVRFADNSTVRIGEFLPVFDKFMNLKY